MLASARHRTQAFTLIELLIVVAIIAILAAIAVPNFLEAQVRAKVARVKNDHRTFALAVESYRVDNNDIPEQSDTTNPGDWPFQRNPASVWGGDRPATFPGGGHTSTQAFAFRLSTPIAYISSTNAFRDVFFKGFGVGNIQLVNDTRNYNYSGDYYKGRTYVAASDGAFGPYEIATKFLSAQNQWHIRSRGPDGEQISRAQGWESYLHFNGKPSTVPSGGGLAADPTGGINSIYDPTNGTVSRGDIVRLGSKGTIN
jgi:prepilin-type N-terminal cleavage/methylation domain-containing protein